MKAISLYLGILFSLSLSANLENPYFYDEIDVPIFLDSHYHFGSDSRLTYAESYQNEKLELQQFYKGNIKKFFLVSDSFEQSLNHSEDTKLVHEMVQSNPSKYIGVCGVQLQPEFNNPEYSQFLDYKSAIEELKNCLSLPGIKGVKLHFQHSLCLSTQEEAKARFEYLITQMKKLDRKNLFFLIHPKDTSFLEETAEDYCDPNAEALEITNYAKKFKNFDFIIAHMLGYQGLAALETKISDNVHLDISVTIQKLFFKEGKEITEAMRKIGLKHFLFGSDNWAPNKTFDNRHFAPEGGKHFEPSPLRSIMASDLSKEEIKTILWDNGKSFWNKINK